MINSFRYAGEGIVWVLKNHRNFTIFLVIAAVVFTFAYVVHVTRIEFIILKFTVSLCLITEMINTAIEEITNLITVKWAHQAKIAKDVAAGMSFITATTSVIIGISIFTPYIMALV